MTEREFVLRMLIQHPVENVEDIKKWYKEVCENTSDGETISVSKKAIEDLLECSAIVGNSTLHQTIFDLKKAAPK